MKVLIIGKDSYIGNYVDEWLSSNGNQVQQLDVLNNSWKTFNYCSYDAIVHVAGIAHRPDCQDWELYKRVNTDMPIHIAQMAKEQGVKQYVFFSTMGVYGIEKKLKPNVIDEKTPLCANSMYGKSKLMAEEGLAKLQSDVFNVVCVRPPSVYGKGCRGNYISGFSTIVEKLPIFPMAYQNVKQSMLYIDNLCEFVRLAIENRLSGAYCPQDDRSVSAIEILNSIANGKGLKRANSRLFGLFVRMLSFLPLVNKAYGGIEYSRSLSTIEGLDYVVVSFEEGMRRTVN